MKRLLLPLLLLSALLLSACGESEPETLAAVQPIEAGDSCHVCGMLITEHPGPKGEAFMEKREEPLKFCSTMDLFAFLKQPENETQVSHAYVHDVAAAPWATPDDEAFVLASEAWYVVGHDQRGAMGHTLASFAGQADAEAFREEHGGEVVSFAEIDLELLGRLGRGELGGELGDGMGDMQHAH